MDSLTNPIPQEHGFGNEQGVLEIHLILLVVGIVGELGIAGDGQVPDFAVSVGDFQAPDLIGLPQRHII